ncbi:MULTISPECIES: sensor histidine kinase [Niastella]|uniref:Histidine kinase n=1 Tax=Niastella soli TaxID=2821487 RepID=A0ABS3Z591_9BACT|nr:histidine kinase [Niastella soli]MBO9205335.1 histidine kinase [Niastella soli]
MTANPAFIVSSRINLVLLTSLAITLLISLPRLLLWQRLTQGRGSFETNVAELSLRALYIFLTSIVYFFIHFQTHSSKIGFVTINYNSFWQRTLISIAIFFILDQLLLHFHMILFSPRTNAPLFKFLFNINMVITFILTILFAQIFRLLLYNYQMRLSNASLLKTNAETKFEVLKNQVNPHFLFNSLNTINSLIVTDQQAAVQFVNNMSEVYRYVLKSHELNSIPLQEELQFITAYTAMLKGRYGNKMQIEVQVSSVWQLYRVPPMALQILVENAVKHNIASRNRPLHIRIFTTDAAALVVTNNRQQRHQLYPSTGIGLQNLNQRCQYLTNHSLTIQQTESSFSVTIPLMNA